MQKEEFTTNRLREVLGDTVTKSETLRKLYGRTKLFTLEDIEEAYNEGKKG